jgi:signal transduction histidine kinase/CheY-like chemotaxis protein
VSEGAPAARPALADLDAATCVEVLVAVFDEIGDAVFVADAGDGRLLAANGPLRTLIGAPEQAGPEINLGDLWAEAPDTLATILGRVRQDRRASWQGRIRRRDGPAIGVDGAFVLVRTADREVVCGVLSPLPPIRLDPSGLGRTRRLESLGLLAGGIAHDFNNLLTSILGHASLALALLPADSAARPPIYKVAGAAGRAADLTRELLAYAGKGQFEVGTVALNDLVIANIGELEMVLARGARLQLDLHPALPLFEADGTQIQQVLTNLVINASEAIGAEGGLVTISTAVLTIGGTEPLALIGGGTLNEGSYVVLGVSDSGAGMSPETLVQIFDPFFSTKGSGRGLGLSTTLGIIRAHAGGLEVTSAQGQGTTFRALFPVATGAVAAVRPPRSVIAADARRASPRATILVVDDEAAVREATGDLLEAGGFTVLTAADGRDGLEQYRERRHEIDLVLLDMKMPVMNGEETLAALRVHDPGLRVVLMSGYSEREATRRVADHGPLSFLQKPYDYDTLLATVNAALG